MERCAHHSVHIALLKNKSFPSKLELRQGKTKVFWANGKTGTE